MNVGMLEIETLHHERSGTSIQATSPFAIRIRKFRETVKALHEKGYREDGANGDLLTRWGALSPHPSHKSTRGAPRTEAKLLFSFQIVSAAPSLHQRRC